MGRFSIISMKHLISIKDLSKNEIMAILQKADKFSFVKKLDTMRGKILASLFFEPSTRTRLSFETAMQRLGGDVISVFGVKSTSLMKGESLEDTIKVISQYADLLLIRHSKVGSAKIASKASDVPVINAGDGINEHPSQNLIDLYTIWKEKGFKDWVVGMVGDLKYSRCQRTLMYPLVLMGVKKFLLTSPEELRMDPKAVKEVEEMGATVKEVKMDEVLRKADILYVSRVQKERFPNKREYEKVKGSYIINANSLKKMKKDAIIMAPLPRIDEIAREVDKDPRAVYFKTVKYGVPVRMAIIDWILG
jgi:aspartate carbamoyltransferase catalytic subunit